MLIDNNMELWLETQSLSGQTVIVAFVKSPKAEQLQYQFQVALKTLSGRSNSKQGGTLELAASQATALGRLQLHMRPEDSCTINISLENDSVLIGNYAFKCPQE